MTPFQCQICKNYGPDKVNILELKDETVFVCKAFPQGIPKEILLGEKSHSENIEGDKGIKFSIIQ